MSNWKFVNQTYLYDGSFDGFLTIVFNSYANKTLPLKIYILVFFLLNSIVPPKKNHGSFLGTKIRGTILIYSQF